MRRQYVMGNWKMHGLLDSIRPLLDNILAADQSPSTQCVVLPPAIYLPYVSQKLKASSLQWGAQNVYPQDTGAFTGEISGPMLHDFGCQYVLVGHSERRHIFHESEKNISEKFHYVKDHDMIPILCVGETQEEHRQGLTEVVLAQQLQAITPSTLRQSYVVAYEPVWAIGTGCVPHPDDIQAVHAFIRKHMAERDPIGAERMSVVYGGSVSPENAQSIFSMPDVDGGLVGGASLDAQKFVDILKCIKSYS